MLSQLGSPNPMNPYTFPANDYNQAVVSPQPSRVQFSAEPQPTYHRESQVAVDEQNAQIAALKHMVADYERQLSEVRASQTARRSQTPNNHHDATKEVLQNYESTINNLKAENMKMKPLDKKVKELEAEKKMLEDEVDKARRIKITLENQLEKWQGLEGNLPELRAKCSKLETDNIRYQTELKRVRSDNYSLKKQVDETEEKYREIKKYEQEASNYVLRIRDLEQEIDFLKEEKKAIRANDNVRQSTLQTETDRLREQNRQLETRVAALARESDQAKAMVSNNTEVMQRMKLVQNENEGLKSMLAMNQKIPKNLIFNDDNNPGLAAGQVDSSKLMSVECQLAITKAELIRLFEENTQIKKKNDQHVGDISILKRKLFRRVGVNSTSNQAESPTAFSNRTIANSHVSRNANKMMVNSVPGSNDDMPGFPGSRGTSPKGSSFVNKMPPTKQVTFDLDSSAYKKNDTFMAEPTDEYAYTRNSQMAKSEFLDPNRRVENAPNKISHSQANMSNKVRLPPAESLNMQDLNFEDDVPRFGLSAMPAYNNSKIAQSKVNDDDFGGNIFSKLSVIHEADPFGGKSENEMYGSNLANQKNSTIMRQSSNPNRVNSSNLAVNDRSNYNQSVTTSNLQRTAIQQHIEPLQESQYVGFVKKRENSLHPELQRSTVNSSQLQPQNGTIDPIALSQLMALLQPNNNSNSTNGLSNSGTKATVPIDPALASQIMAHLQASNAGQQYSKQPLQASTYPQIFGQTPEVNYSNLNTVSPAQINVTNSSRITTQTHTNQQQPIQSSTVTPSNIQYRTTEGPDGARQSSVEPIRISNNQSSYHQGYTEGNGQPNRVVTYQQERSASPLPQERSVSPAFGNQTSYTNGYSTTAQGVIQGHASPRNQTSNGMMTDQTGYGFLQSSNQLRQSGDQLGGPLVKTLQPIYLPEHAFNRNVIFTNDGKQVLIPIHGGANHVRQDSGSMSVTMDQLGIHKMKQSAEPQVKRVVLDNTQRSRSPGASRDFMPLLFPSTNSASNPQGSTGQGQTYDRGNYSSVS
jgi:hypothetical protein